MKFTMYRDVTVNTMLGRSIEFKKGEPTHVPPQCEQAVIEAGGMPEDPEVLNVAQLDAKGRELAIAEAVKAVMASAKRTDFNKDGVPHAAVLSALCGFQVEAKERDAAWAKAQAGLTDD